ncbi:hypothetical protein Taro_055726 [Colocasia esculenta]|uniref:Uncharacterized protein n=1 Tax=Colocasia esculenta TaxID=4460 RepID=A0A843XUH3_COLES|nr:hypothetical protein [Colocasia esculenta]
MPIGSASRSTTPVVPGLPPDRLRRLSRLQKINVQLQGEDRSMTCFPLYYIVVARTRSKTSGLMERVPLVRPGSRRYMFTRPEDLPRA